MRKILCCLLAFGISLILLCACETDPESSNPTGSGSGDISNGSENDAPPPKNEDNTAADDDEIGEYIWEQNSPLFVISSAEEAGEEKYSTVYGTVVSEVYTLLSYVNESVRLSPDSSAVADHEIVVGRADRDISRRAYAEIEALALAEDEVCFLIYSDGYSLALAYTNAEENVAIKKLSEYFGGMVKESVALEEGVVHFEIYSMTEIYQARDDAMVQKAWEDYEKRVYTYMAKVIGADEAKSYSEELVAELKKLHSMYTDDLVDWFAGLYEPYICICEGECQKTRYCGGAGFYYSNSARDNDYTVRREVEYMLLPDAETTAQVLGFINRSGMIKQQGGSYYSAFPEGEAERIVRFIKALQDENSGYFYHPQWLSMLGTSAYWDSRQSRDLSYSLSVLYAFGAKPTYRTPSGAEGDGILYDGTDLNLKTKSSLTLPMNISRAAAVSKVVAKGSVHPNLESLESFNRYLSTLNLAGNSYYVGNELASLAPQIIERDKALGTPENPRPLATRLDEWLRANQDPETGYWHKYSSSSVYYPINGLLKIAALYNTLGMPFPNPLPAARSAFAVITSEEKIGHVCDLYNTWFSVSLITQNLRNYSSNAALAESIIAEVRTDAVEAVRVTAEKMKAHQKSDGSFSYFENRSSQDSQNAPVAMPNTNEGDVNATVIFTYGILDYMYDVLGFGTYAPLLTDCDRKVFVNILEEKIAASEKRKAE